MNKYEGFGYNKDFEVSHFRVDIKKEAVEVYEVPEGRFEELKASVDLWKWDIIKKSVKDEFNDELFQDKIKSATWKKSTNVKKAQVGGLLLVVFLVLSRKVNRLAGKQVNR